MLAAVWGSPMVIDGKVYLGDEDGDVVVLQAGKEKKLIAEMNMGSSVYATPVPANGTLFMMNRNQLFALVQWWEVTPATTRGGRARPLAVGVPASAATRRARRRRRARRERGRPPTAAGGSSAATRG